MDSLLSVLSAQELREADRYLHVFLDSGSMSADELAEWHRRIRAWQQFVLESSDSWLPH